LMVHLCDELLKYFCELPFNTCSLCADFYLKPRHEHISELRRSLLVGRYASAGLPGCRISCMCTGHCEENVVGYKWESKMDVARFAGRPASQL
jgi:hypothetical protein